MQACYLLPTNLHPHCPAFLHTNPSTVLQQQVTMSAGGSNGGGSRPPSGHTASAGEASSKPPPQSDPESQANKTMLQKALESDKPLTLGGFQSIHHLGFKTDSTQYLKPMTPPARPGFNTTGKPCNVEVNAYQVVATPTRTVYQYDVSWTFPCPFVRSLTY